MSKISGIYKISNLLNDKVYIGKSMDIKKRHRTKKHTEESKQKMSASRIKLFSEKESNNDRF